MSKFTLDKLSFNEKDGKDYYFISKDEFKNLIENNELYGVESNIDFLHVSNLDIYKKLLQKRLKILRAL